MTRELTCIVCPNGCPLHIEELPGGYAVTGNKCKRGEAFAKEELTAPRRVLCSTVRTAYPEVPVLPVRTAGGIPKEKMFAVMAEINRIVIRSPVGRGDIVIRNVLGLGVDVIATSSILQETQREDNV